MGKGNEKTTVMSRGIRSATAFIRRCGFSPVKGHCKQGYHYNFGFFRSPAGRLWYWATSDDRWAATMPPVVRTAKDLSDFTGGSNNYPLTDQDLMYLVLAGDRSELPA